MLGTAAATNQVIEANLMVVWFHLSSDFMVLWFVAWTLEVYESKHVLREGD